MTLNVHVSVSRINIVNKHIATRQLNLVQESLGHKLHSTAVDAPHDGAACFYCARAAPDLLPDGNKYKSRPNHYFSSIEKIRALISAS